MREQTLIVIKPGAVKRRQTGEILTALEAAGLRVTDIRMVALDHERAEAFYAEHRGREYFDRVVEHSSSGPSVAVVVEGAGAIQKVRTMLGPADPQGCDGRTQLRGRFGWQLPDNGLHASDSDEAFARELHIVNNWPPEAAAVTPEASSQELEQLPPGGQFPDAQ